MTSASSLQGRCTLVGAGPGDPELLTLKAVKAIQAATVLLVDDLVSDEILAHAAARRAHRPRRQARRLQEHAAGLHREADDHRGARGRARGAPQGRRSLHLRPRRRRGGAPARGRHRGRRWSTASPPAWRPSPRWACRSRTATTRRAWSSSPATPRPATRREQPTDWRQLAAAARDARLTLVIYMGVERRGAHPAGPAGRPAGARRRWRWCSTPPCRSSASAHARWSACTRRCREGGMASPAVIVVGDVLRGMAAAGIARTTGRIAARTAAVTVLSFMTEPHHPSTPSSSAPAQPACSAPPGRPARAEGAAAGPRRASIGREDPHLRRRPLQLHQPRPRRARAAAPLPRREPALLPLGAVALHAAATSSRWCERHGIAYHEKHKGQLFCDGLVAADHRHAAGRMRGRRRGALAAVQGGRGPLRRRRAATRCETTRGDRARAASW